VVDSIKIAVDEKARRNARSVPADYSIPDTSWRVLKLSLGNAGLSNTWDGITKNG
jgi:hypothetical protein